MPRLNLIDYAPFDYTPPAEIDGIATEQVLWRGRQWMVTTEQIVAYDNEHYCYWIDPKEFEVAPHWYRKGEFYTDIEHVGLKPWCDLEDFIAACLVGFALHGVKVDSTILWQSIKATRAEKAREAANLRQRIGRPVEPIDADELFKSGHDREVRNPPSSPTIIEEDR